MSTLQHLAEKELVKPPRWLPANVMYETIMGSVAYGVSGDTSDMDVCGWAIPPKDDVFPHLRGEVAGFGTPRPRFEQFEAHHVVDPDALGGSGRCHDVTIYSIVKFFRLAMENNPNIRARAAPALPPQGLLAEVQGICLRPAPQNRDEAAGRRPFGDRRGARLRREICLSRRAAARRGGDDPGGGGSRSPARQRAAQGDPAG